MDIVWSELIEFYRPWIFPLPKEMMSVWIQEMCTTKLLLPWRWQDKEGPRLFVNSFVSVTQFAFQVLKGTYRFFLLNMRTCDLYFKYPLLYAVVLHIFLLFICQLSTCRSEESFVQSLAPLCLISLPPKCSRLYLGSFS